MRNLSIWLLWAHFSDYHSRQLGDVIEDHYQTSILYHAPDWQDFDVVFPFFAGPRRHPDCERNKILKFVWEPHEMGWAGDAGTVCAASTPIYELTKQRYPDCHLLPWGVNPDHFYPTPLPDGDRVVVGWAGAYKNPRKRFDELEAALTDVPGLEFRPNKSWLKLGRQVGDYELPGINRYYETIHVYACASHNEGFCFPLLEAAACGRAIVSFDVGCARDLLDSGAGVVIVEDLDEMREAILSADLEELGKQSAKAVAKHWTWRKLRDRWLEVLDGVG